MKKVNIAIAVLFAIGCMNVFGISSIIILHLLAFAGLMEILNGIIHLFWKNKKKSSVWNKIFQCGLVPVFLTLAVLIYGYFHMDHVCETTYVIKTDKLEGEQTAYTAAFLSDLHFGTTMDEKRLKEICDEISDSEPDVVILGGDIVDESTSKEEMEEAFQALGNMKSKYGVFFVYGNHDCSSYSMSPNYTKTDLDQALIKNEIIILSDQIYPIGKDLLLVGRKDKGYGNSSSRKAAEELIGAENKERFIILADHQPLDLQKNADAGVDLQLSGHTHGGQIWPVGIICEIFGIGEMNYGEKQIGSFDAIVSSGIAGWGYNIRTERNSEYVIVKIENK